MEKLPTIFWVLAYTLTGADILLGFVVFMQKRDKKISAYLLLLLNVFVITLISFLFSLSLIGEDLFSLLLQNGLLFLYLVLPNLLYRMNDLPFRRKSYLIFFSFAFLILNLLFFLGISVFPYFYFFCWIPFFASGLIVYRHVKKEGIAISDRGNPLYFYKSLKSSWNMTGIVAALMGLSSLLLYFISPFAAGYAFSIFFAAFYSLYCLPSLVYFAGALYFKKNDAVAFDELTEREKEVAMLIMDGKKYREIGDELFISLSTVKKHANNIYRKTGTANGRELIRSKLNSRTS